ncbi:MAG: glycosyltransferase family 2 protein [Kiloniellales bacterium]|nr:glycosyltransferase family 2 protein [Kiloniellales bacterium]
MMQALQLSIVVPLKNEQEILYEKVEELALVLDEEVGPDRWNAILVDNGSTDRTPQIIQEIKERWPLTQPIRLEEPNIGKAMRAGLRASEAPYVFIMPIDENDVPFLTWAWRAREHYDLIIGSKRLNPVLNGQSPYRRFLTWGLNAMLSLLTEYIGADTHGCKLLRREAILPIDKRCVISRGQYDSELTIRSVRCGLRVAELPVVYSEKRPARDFMLKKIARNVVDLLRLYRALKNEPFVEGVHFHRWARSDVEDKVLPWIGTMPGRAEISHSSD